MTSQLNVSGRRDQAQWTRLVRSLSLSLSVNAIVEVPKGGSKDP